MSQGRAHVGPGFLRFGTAQKSSQLDAQKILSRAGFVMQSQSAALDLMETIRLESGSQISRSTRLEIPLYSCGFGAYS